MDTSLESATSDEAQKSIKNLELAVERAISLHVSVEQVQAVVDGAIEEMMKKDLVLAVERAMSVHLRPEEIRDVVSGAIQESRKRRSMELSRSIMSHLLISPSHRAHCCRAIGVRRGVGRSLTSKVRSHKAMESNLSDGPILRLYSAFGVAISEVEWTQWTCPSTSSTRTTPSQQFGGYIQLSRTNIHMQRALEEGEQQGLRGSW